MVRNPSLRHKPLGIKQKNLMVTCNYVARSMGVKKTMWIKEAVEALPELVLVDGSDLAHYRQFSAEISAVAQTFTDNVERLGMDENFVDVTDLVKEQLDDCSGVGSIVGHVYGDKEGDGGGVGDPCGCGCRERLVAGTHIAEQLRKQILEETGITCCAGVAHNKLLAKLVSGYHKPNQQSVIFPWQVKDLMNSIEKVGNIPGIGNNLCKNLEKLGIITVKNLQSAPLSLLQTKFDKKLTVRLKNVSFGIDEMPVKKSGQPQSIGVEDAFRENNYCEAEIRAKYHALLGRLLKLLAEDGRVPASIRVSVRKYDANKRFGQREIRQAPVSPSLFAAGVKNVDDGSRASLLKLVMGVFHKMCGSSKQYQLTLVGIAFFKFVDRADEAQSITSFFSKQMRAKDKEQESNIPSVITHKTDAHEATSVKRHDADEFKSVTSFFSKKMRAKDKEQESNIPSVSTHKTDAHEATSVKRRDDDSDRKNCRNLRLITSKSDSMSGDLSAAASQASGVFSSDMCYDDGAEKSTAAPATWKSSPPSLPAGVDPEVFQSLPRELQDEILNSYELVKKSSVKFKQVSSSPKKVSKGIDGYFKPRDKPEISLMGNTMKKRKLDESSGETSNFGDNGCDETAGCSYQSTSNIGQKVELSEENSLQSLLTSNKIDPSVFSALPADIQQEIIQEQKHSQMLPNVNSRTPVQNKTKQLPSILRHFKKL